MVVVAIAGGSGNLGRAFVDALQAKGGCTIIILARSENKEKEKEIGVPIVAVDYSNIESVVKVLESYEVDTLISTVDSNVGAGPELVLIQAAERSAVTRRYIPCLWGIEYAEWMIPFFPVAKTKLEIIETLKQTTDLEWTEIRNGLFTDFYVSPGVESYFNPLPLVLDIQGKAASVPGTGDEPVVFTHTFDLAKYVARLVLDDSSRWEQVSVVVGDKISWNEFVTIAQEATGSKFEVTYDSGETLKQGKVGELPSHPHLYPFFPKEAMQGMFASFGLLFSRGAFDLKSESDGPSSFNGRYPDIKPRTVKELVHEAWGHQEKK